MLVVRNILELLRTRLLTDNGCQAISKSLTDYNNLALSKLQSNRLRIDSPVK